MPELVIPNPAVISFTMATAAFAFSEFLHRGRTDEHRDAHRIRTAANSQQLDPVRSALRLRKSRAVGPRGITSSPHLRRHHYRGVVRVSAHDPKLLRLAREGHLVVQTKGDRPTWLIMVCPCRCAEVLRVNLMPSIQPRLGLTTTERGVTVDPSLDVRSEQSS